jgi:hypothetical protein
VTRGRAIALILVALAAGACGGNRGQPAGPPLPTPVASWSTEVAGSMSVLRDALAAAGYQLYVPRNSYRPSEPAGLTTTLRAVMQVSGPDPDMGYVLVYDLGDADAAASAGVTLAAYLGSGFGQTNYPLDAQFSVAQLGGTVIFTWWSRERAGDPDHYQGAFDAIRTVGQPIPVLK